MRTRKKNTALRSDGPKGGAVLVLQETFRLQAAKNLVSS
jgi:hypothetical protein